MYVTEDNGLVVSLIVFRIEHDYGCIDNIVVHKSKQRKGVGRALVSHIEHLVRADGGSLMKTDTTENVDGVPWRAYHFWIKLGYEDMGKRIPIDNNSQKFH